MEKKESPKKEAPKKEFEAPVKPSFISGKLAKVYNKIFGIIKFFLGICLLPFVYSTTVAFLSEFSIIDKPLQNYFWSGVITLLLVYLFIWEPAVIYAKGHKLLEIIFNFFQPLVRVAPYLIPIYTLVLFLMYGLFSIFIEGAWLTNYAMFLFGLSIALHLVFSAKAIRSKKEDFLKGNYIFGFSFIYIINLGLLAFGVNLIFDKFSFVNFSNVSLQIAKGILATIFRQLFVPA